MCKLIVFAARSDLWIRRNRDLLLEVMDHLRPNCVAFCTALRTMACCACFLILQLENDWTCEIRGIPWLCSFFLNKSIKQEFQWVYKLTVVVNVAIISWLLTPRGPELTLAFLEKVFK